MPGTARKKFRIITIIYWLLLSYIVAALVWWFITLEKQNQLLTDLRISELNSKKGILEPEKFTEQYLKIESDSGRNTKKYVDGLVSTGNFISLHNINNIFF